MSNNLDNSIFILPGELNAAAVESLKKDMLKYVEKNHVIALDGSMVEQVDALGIQLILSAQKLCIASGKNFSVTNVSNELRRILEVTGILDILEE